MEIKDILKKRRIQLGMSMKVVSKKVGVSEATISRWESGDIANMGREKIASLSRALELNPAVILGIEEGLSQEESFSYPFISQGVSAGELETMDGITSLETISIPDAFLGRHARNKHLMIMRVNGESMNHILPDQSVIAVRTDVELGSIHNGDIVVISNGGDYTVKKFYNDTEGKRFIFKPDSSSPAFTDIVFPYEECDDVRLIGRVVMYNVMIG